MKKPFSKIENKTLKTFLYLSLLPYGALVFSAFIGYTAGINFFGWIDGKDGAFWAAALCAYGMCIIPVLPASVIFQIVTFTRLKMNEHNLSKKSRIKVVLGIIGGFLIIALGIFAYGCRYAIKEYFDGFRAKRYFKEADSVVVFDMDKQNDSAPFALPDCGHDLFTINYDHKEICFMMRQVRDELYVYELEPAEESDLAAAEEASIKRGDFTCIASPGERVIIFENSSFYDIDAIFLRMQDGSLWYAERTTEGELVWFDDHNLKGRTHIVLR